MFDSASVPQPIQSNLAANYSVISSSEEVSTLTTSKVEKVWIEAF